MSRTLAETFGSQETVTLENLPEVLGERMPELEFTPTGRLRLLKALRMRFGDDFINIRAVRELLSEFDNKLSTQAIISRNRSNNG